jgi:choline dehydrogenase
MPLAWGLVFRHRLFDWHYCTEPESMLDGRRIECARGRVIGGSSSVNGMVYSRGIPDDYDRWHQQWGLENWGFDDVLPYFMKSEHWPQRGAEGRGSQGPMHLTELRDADPLTHAFMRAVQDGGYGLTQDYNGRQCEGFGAIQATIHKGRRWSAAAAYLRPALRSSNLSLSHKLKALFL